MPVRRFVQESSAILLRVFVAFALAVAGGIVSASVGLSHERLCGLISLAAGTLLGVTLFTILPEAAEAMKIWEMLLALASGYAVFYFVSKHVFHVCPACAASHFDEATTHRFGEIASALIIALGLHSTLDGVAIAAGHETNLVQHGQGDVSVLLAVCVHKVPEGLALGALLLGAGFRPTPAVLWVAAVEATTLVGGVIGLLWLRDATPFWLDAVLAHAGGGFVFLAAHAVLGELVKHGRKIVLVNFAAGVAIIAVSNVIVRVMT
jgi:zinc transporter ZupT